MLPDWIGMGCYFGFLIALGLPVILLKACVQLPFEITRKLYHLLITLSIFPLVKCFENWYMAVLTVFLLAALAYPALALAEKTAWFQRIAVERKGGEFRSSLLVVFLVLAAVRVEARGWPHGVTAAIGLGTLLLLALLVRDVRRVRAGSAGRPEPR